MTSEKLHTTLADLVLETQGNDQDIGQNKWTTIMGIVLSLTLINIAGVKR